MPLLPPAAPRRTRNLALDLVESIGARITSGALEPGAKLPTEAEFMAGFGVSRTVVREALSRLQAAGQVHTRHGIGTFVVAAGDTAPFSISPQRLATLQDVISMLELRIGVETEAAALAAMRRSGEQLARMQAALGEFDAMVEAGLDAVDADLRFHLEIASATRNPHFAALIGALGAGMIPRARLQEGPARLSAEQRDYLRRVNTEHTSVCDAIAAQDPDAARAAMRMHLANSRERRRRAQLEAQRVARRARVVVR